MILHTVPLGSETGDGRLAECLDRSRLEFWAGGSVCPDTRLLLFVTLLDSILGLSSAVSATAWGEGEINVMIRNATRRP